MQTPHSGAPTPTQNRATPQQPDPIVLSPPLGSHRWSGYHSYPSLNFTHFNAAKRIDGHFARMHGCEDGTTWFGIIIAFDQLGRRWERNFNAVVDDFGDLVEVRQ